MSTIKPKEGRYKLPEPPVDPLVVYGMWIALHYVHDAVERGIDVGAYLKGKYLAALDNRKFKSQPTESKL